MTRLFDTGATDEFGNSYMIEQYCSCDESVAEEIDGKWYCEDCNLEIEYEPDADLLTDEYWEQQSELL